jgi:hypothetical protein
VKDARKAVDAAFRQICDIINVYMLLEGDANYETFARTLNEVLGRYRKKHRHHAHHTRKMSEPEFSELKNSQNNHSNQPAEVTP